MLHHCPCLPVLFSQWLTLVTLLGEPYLQPDVIELVVTVAVCVHAGMSMDLIPSTANQHKINTSSCVE